MVRINKFILRPFWAIFGRFLALALSGPDPDRQSLIKFSVSRREKAFLWSAGQALKIALILGLFGFAALILSPYYVCSLFLAGIHTGRLKNSGPGLQLLYFWSSPAWRSKAAARGLICRLDYNKNPIPAGPIRSGSNGPFSLGIFGAFCLMGPYMGLFFIYLGLGILYFQA